MPANSTAAEGEAPPARGKKTLQQHGVKKRKRPLQHGAIQPEALQAAACPLLPCSGRAAKHTRSNY